MDTRTKILTPEEARALAGGGQSVALVTGHFDGLQAADGRDLRRVRERFPGATLLVAVAPPPQPIFEARARAEMAAALGVVDYVVSLEDPQIAALAAAVPAQRVVRLEAAQQQRMRELIQHVKRRQTE
jgi:bifunctional ADP-heptose synthase (sugar kinase/adenylyltransferase)